MCVCGECDSACVVSVTVCGECHSVCCAFVCVSDEGAPLDKRTHVDGEEGCQSTEVVWVSCKSKDFGKDGHCSPFCAKLLNQLLHIYSGCFSNSIHWNRPTEQAATHTDWNRPMEQAATHTDWNRQTEQVATHTDYSSNSSAVAQPALENNLVHWISLVDVEE